MTFNHKLDNLYGPIVNENEDRMNHHLSDYVERKCEGILIFNLDSMCNFISSVMDTFCIHNTRIDRIFISTNDSLGIQGRDRERSNKQSNFIIILACIVSFIFCVVSSACAMR